MSDLDVYHVMNDNTTYATSTERKDNGSLGKKH